MSARRLRKHRASVRRANHRAVSQHGHRFWIGDAYVEPASIYGAVWVRDTRHTNSVARAGFVMTRNRGAR